MSEYSMTNPNTCNDEIVCYFDTPEPPRMVEVMEDEKFCRVLDIEDPLISQIAEVASIRDSILNLPSAEEGLNMDRVNEYRRKMGVARKELRVLDEKDYQTMQDLLRHGEDKILTHAGYIPTVDLAVVKRNRESEEQYGPGITESIIVHEMAHASFVDPIITFYTRRAPRDSLKEERQVTAIAYARVGFTQVMPDDTKPGSFIEEGWAEYERGRYIVDELGKPEGFFPQFRVGSEEALLNKYIFERVMVDGKAEAGESALVYAGAGMELLIRHDPELLDLIRRSRSSTEAYQDVRDTIESVSTGLYDFMGEADIYNFGIDGPKKSLEVLDTIYVRLKASRQ